MCYHSFHLGLLFRFNNLKFFHGAVSADGSVSCGAASAAFWSKLPRAKRQLGGPKMLSSLSGSRHATLKENGGFLLDDDTLPKFNIATDKLPKPNR